MSWARLDDTLHSHPKVLDADLEAMGLWVRALSHCAAYLTDGHVRRTTCALLAGAAERGERLAAKLVAVGLWELHASGDGWQFHDYASYNLPAAEVRAKREAITEARRRAGHLGGLRSGETRRSKGEANREANAKQNEAPIPSHTHTQEKREAPAMPAPDAGASALQLQVVDGKKSEKAPKKRTAAPDTTDVEELQAFCASWQLDGRDPEVLAMLDHHRKKGDLFADWKAAWRTWKRRAGEYAAKSPPPTRTPGGQPVDHSAPWLKD